MTPCPPLRQTTPRSPRPRGPVTREAGKWRQHEQRGTDEKGVDGESGTVFQMQKFPSRPSALVTVPSANFRVQRGDYYARPHRGSLRLGVLGCL